MATKDTKKPTSKTTLTWVTDKLAAGAARVNGGEYQDVEVAVVKATNHDLVPPKEKHVRTLRECINAAPSRRKVIYIIHDLYERLKSTGEDWLIVLKTLMVFHKLIKSDVDGNFQVEIIKYKEKRKLGNVLRMDNFSDNTNKEGWDFSAWIRVYSIYLDDRLDVFDTIKFDLERDVGGEDTRFKKLASKDLLDELPKIQKLLQRVLACIPYGAAAESLIVMDCLKWVLTECFRLYRAISEGVINLADQFFDMDKVSARKGLEIYRESLSSTQQMQTFFSSIQTLPVGRQMTFPQLQSPPEDFLIQMEEFVNGISVGKEKVPARIARNLKTGDQKPSAFDKGESTTKGITTINMTPKKEDTVAFDIDLLSLDALTIDDSITPQRDDYHPATQKVQDPFGDSAFSGIMPYTASSNKSAPVFSVPIASASHLLNDWGSNTHSFNLNEGAKSVVSVGDNPSQSSPFDDFFGGGPMAQPPPPPASATFAPPAYIPVSHQSQMGGMRDPFGAAPQSGNPFGMAPIQTTPPTPPPPPIASQNPYNNIGYGGGYSQNTSPQYFGNTGGGSSGSNSRKIMDPFLDLSADVIRHKAANAPPQGTPMRGSTESLQKNEMQSFQQKAAAGNPFGSASGIQSQTESYGFF